MATPLYRPKRLVHSCGQPPVVPASYRARSERHPLLVMQNDDGDRAEFTTPDIADPVDDRPVIVLGNGEYRRAIGADGIGALWRDMLIIAACIVAAVVFVWLTGGAV